MWKLQWQYVLFIRLDIDWIFVMIFIHEILKYWILHLGIISLYIGLLKTILIENFFLEKTTIESMTLCLKNLNSINTYRIFSFIRAHFVLDLSWCLLITHGSQLHSRLFLSFSSGKSKQSVSAILSKGK